VKKNTCTVIVDIIPSIETECPEMPVASVVSHAAQQNFPSDFGFGLWHISATSEQSSVFTMCPNSLQSSSILIY
jgi:hypothetical protein